MVLEGVHHWALRIKSFTVYPVALSAPWCKGMSSESCSHCHADLQLPCFLGLLPVSALEWVT